MRKIAATYLFPIVSPPIKYGTLILNDDGQIIEIIDPKGKLIETEKLEYYNGILVPGFVNAHCHLELSYMKGLIPGGNGLTGFIDQLISKRTALPINLDSIIQKADSEMKSEGIVAVGDVTNDDFSIEIKKRSSIYYHSFVEVFDRDPAKAKEVFNNGLQLFNKYKLNGLDCSMVAHAPYTITNELLDLLKTHNNSIYTIHNQETDSENTLFINKSGAMFELLSKFGSAMNGFKPTGESSIQSIIARLPSESNVLLVHNIFTSQSDIDNVQKALANVYWVLCPNSNLIIENKLPDIHLFMNNDLQIAIGTDSYSSNNQLSILSELKIIQEYFPNINLNSLMQWATLNGAKALKISDRFGSFELGKKPGVNLITDIDFEKMNLLGSSSVQVLI